MCRYWRLVRQMAAWVVLSRTKAKMLALISTGRLHRQAARVGSAIAGVVESWMIQGRLWQAARGRWLKVLVVEDTKRKVRQQSFMVTQARRRSNLWHSDVYSERHGRSHESIHALIRNSNPILEVFGILKFIL